MLLRLCAEAAVQPVLLRLESVLLRPCAEAAVGEHRPKMASALLPRDMVLEGSGCRRVPTQGARGSGDHATGVQLVDDGLHAHSRGSGVGD